VRGKRNVKMRIIDDLKKKSYFEMKRKAENRESWRACMPTIRRKAETNDDDES